MRRHKDTRAAALLVPGRGGGLTSARNATMGRRRRHTGRFPHGKQRRRAGIGRRHMRWSGCGPGGPGCIVTVPHLRARGGGGEGHAIGGVRGVERAATVDRGAREGPALQAGGGGAGGQVSFGLFFKFSLVRSGAGPVAPSSFSSLERDEDEGQGEARRGAGACGRTAAEATKVLPPRLVSSKSPFCSMGPMALAVWKGEGVQV